MKVLHHARHRLSSVHLTKGSGHCPFTHPYETGNGGAVKSGHQSRATEVVGGEAGFEPPGTRPCWGPLASGFDPQSMSVFSLHLPPGLKNSAVVQEGGGICILLADSC